MQKEMIERFEQFSYSINVIYRYVLKIEREEMEKYGYRGSYALYLAIMYHFPDGLTASKLSEISDRDKAGISRIVAEMEQKGLITKQSNHDNFYRAKLVLTPKGRDVADLVRKKAIYAVSRAGDGISDEDRKIFYDCLFSISSNLKKISSEGIPDCEND
ncbi:MAG: MarR family winged helix-turn-helix transcriptional regulator [Eubacteriales bacterium]